jgi:hypothetical protein
MLRHTLKGFTFARILLGLIAMAALTSLALVTVRSAHAQGGGGDTEVLVGGPTTMSQNGVARLAICSPEGGGGGGGGAVRYVSFFDCFLEFTDASGVNKRVKVQFFWDRQGKQGDLTTVTVAPAQNGFTWNIDREPPTFVQVPGVPAGVPVTYTLVPVIQVLGLHNTDLDPVARIRVSNLGSSGQDGVDVDLKIRK